METDECWETFLSSGKVTDYLKYKNQGQSSWEDDSKNADSFSGGYGRGYAGYQDAPGTAKTAETIR